MELNLERIKKCIEEINGIGQKNHDKHIKSIEGKWLVNQVFNNHVLCFKNWTWHLPSGKGN